MSRLREIFHNSLTLGSDKWDPYFDVYSRYLEPYIAKPITFVEVGVQRGGSLQMWREYLGPQARIIGIDIDTNIMNLAPHFDANTTLIVGDQESPAFWREFFEKYPEVDIFLDDGGHTMIQQIVTFENVFPRIKTNGLYMCEDTHTSYFHEFDSGLYYTRSFVEYSKKLVDILNLWHIENDDKNKLDQNVVKVCEMLSSVHFYDSMIIFERNGRKEFKRVYSLADKS